MRSRTVGRFILLLALAAAFVALASSAATATYVPGAGFTTSAIATATPIAPNGMFAPWRPTMGDLDGDGIPDIVSGSAWTTGGVGVMLGLGGGKFSAMTTITLGQSIPNVSIEDIDRDGVADLVANMSGVYAWTLIGQGDGTFSQPTTITNSFGARDSHLTDCDNDGIKDLVTVGSQVTLRKGDGAGGFGSAQVSTVTVSMGQSGVAIDLADVNGDGLKDVVAVDGARGELRFFRGTGNGFSFETSIAVDGGSSGPQDVAFVQLDQDARPEIVAVNRRVPGYTGKVIAYDGAAGTFAYAQSWETALAGGASQVEVGDVDQDGWDDVFVPEFYTYTIHGFDNAGNGTLTDRYDWVGPAYFSGSYPFGLVDADGDGRLDMIAGYGNTPGNFAIADNTLPAKVTRIFGPNRFATAAAASASALATSGAVVIATGAKFPDALSAAGLCGALRAPLLLVKPDSIPESVTAEITRLHATKAYIVGGPSSVGTAVADALAGLPLSLETTRIAGDDRYDTSRKVANWVRRLTGPGREVFVARGDLFPDALAASPLAYSGQIPIVLTKPTVLSPAALGALEDLNVNKAAIIGNAITANVYNQISVQGIETTRLAGTDRYRTAAAVAAYGVQRHFSRWRFTYVATGADFPDALGGGAAAGNLNGLLLLTAKGSLSPGAQTALHDNREAIGAVRVLGGTSAVTDTTLGQIRTAVQ